MSSPDERRRVQRGNYDSVNPPAPLAPDWWEECEAHDKIPTGITLRWRDQCRARRRTKAARRGHDGRVQAEARRHAQMCAKRDWGLLDWVSFDSH
jgi:hypothetical protein